MSKRQAKKLGIRAYRSAVAKLKRLGLVSKRIDARSHKPTRYMLKQLDRFSDVLNDKAIVVKARKRDEAKKFGELYDVKFNRVVVLAQKGERGRFTKDGLKIIRKSAYQDRGEITELVVPHKPDELQPLPAGGSYAVPFRRGNEIKRQFFESEQLLLDFIRLYEKKPDEEVARYEGIRGYVQIITADKKGGQATG